MSRILLDTAAFSAWARGYGPIKAPLQGARRRGTPVGHNDMWIAATAYQHGLRVLTLDGDFKKIPQVLVDYIEPPHA